LLAELPVGINERLNYDPTVISAYPPTMDAEENIHDHFYSQLDQVQIVIPNVDKLILLVDVHARITLLRQKDMPTWTQPRCRNNKTKTQNAEAHLFNAPMLFRK